MRRVADASNTSKQPGVITTGTEQEEAARKADAIKRTIAGDSPADSSSAEEQIVRETRKWAATEDALEFVLREKEAELKFVGLHIQKPKGNRMTWTWSAWAKRCWRSMVFCSIFTICGST